MRIQPRQQLLEIWQATARTCFRDGQWVWGGRHQGSSISDAEQLLCIMLPATEIPRFRLDRPDETDRDALRVLRTLGDHVDIPRQLVQTLTDYMRNYAGDDGVPIFPGGSYLSSKDPDNPPREAQASLDLVESFATSITLTLATIGFCRIFLTSLNRPELISQVTELEALANRRLTAALVGLLRSFTINVFAVDSDSGKRLLRTINQEHLPLKTVIEAFNQAQREVRAGLRDYITVGTGQNVDLNPSRLFECGWSWGVIEDAPKISFIDGALQREGHAIDAPYLYFTVVALDGIADLFSSRTRLLGLLDEEQQRLARALQIRWELTQTYWALIASFGGARWPLEDIPWRTVDGEESDYFSLLVTAIAARDLAQRRDTDVDLSRLGQVLTELANRGRLVRRPFSGDPAVLLHHPGVSIALDYAGPNPGPALVYGATDFAPLLLKRALRVAGLINDIELRGTLLELADQVWDHVAERKMRDGTARDLWDQPALAYDMIRVRYDQPTWHHTVRVVESLVLAAELAATHPLRSEGLATLAQDLLAEAEHLFDQEQLAGSTEAGRSMRVSLETVRQRLQRAREIAFDRPGTAAAVLLTVLAEIDQLAAARSDVVGRD
jgi:hypothetical protein